MMHPANSADDNRGKWMALIAAFLGWMFDGFEMGMFPLGRAHALKELLAAEIAANPTAKDEWFGVIMAVFLVGAATGGVLFGWLGDRIGRVRAMSLSIFTYAIFTGLCGFAAQAWHIAVLRFIASLGMGGEWSLGVALVTELWPDRSRAFLAGPDRRGGQRRLPAGRLAEPGAGEIHPRRRRLAARLGIPENAVATLLRGDGWRLLMIAGALPALLIFFIRSVRAGVAPAGRRQASAAGLALGDARPLGVLIGACAALGMVVLWSPISRRRRAGGRAAACRRRLPRLADGGARCRNRRGIHDYARRIHVPGGTLSRSLGSRGSFGPGRRGTLLAAHAAGRLSRGRAAVGHVGIVAVGALSGRSPWRSASADRGRVTTPRNHADRHCRRRDLRHDPRRAGRRPIRPSHHVLSFLCIGSFASLVYMYQRQRRVRRTIARPRAFVAGGVTAAFYGWFPLYFPEIFPTSIRATSQGFAFNFGRVLSAVGSLQTAVLTAYFAQGLAPERRSIDGLANSATLAGMLPRVRADALPASYLVGVLIIWLRSGDAAPGRCRISFSPAGRPLSRTSIGATPAAAIRPNILPWTTRLPTTATIAARRSSCRSTCPRGEIRHTSKIVPFAAIRT